MLFFRIEYLLLGRSQSGVGLGVGADIFIPEFESESVKFRRLRSPALRLKMLMEQCRDSGLRYLHQFYKYLALDSIVPALLFVLIMNMLRECVCKSPLVSICTYIRRNTSGWHLWVTNKNLNE